jgi:hypothetical protein
VALDDVAAAQPPELNIDPIQFDGAKTPSTGPRILHHHPAIHVADGVSERIEIPEGAGPHENRGVSVSCCGKCMEYGDRLISDCIG